MVGNRILLLSPHPGETAAVNEYSKQTMLTSPVRAGYVLESARAMPAPVFDQTVEFSRPDLGWLRKLGMLLVTALIWFQGRNELFTGKVFAGLAAVILIGLAVEHLVFQSLERLTVRRWGMQR